MSEDGAVAEDEDEDAAGVWGTSDGEEAATILIKHRYFTSVMHQIHAYNFY